MSEKKTPELRFAGFTDAWEQRELGEVITVGNGKDYKHLDEGDIPVYGTGGYMLSVSEALSENKDAIGIGRKGTIDKTESNAIAANIINTVNTLATDERCRTASKVTDKKIRKLYCARPCGYDCI